MISAHQRSEAIRRAIDSWLVSEQPVRPPRNDFDLVGAVAMQYRCSRAEARVKVRLGEVMVNGQVEKRFTLPPGRPGQVYAITRTPNSTG